MTGQSRLIAALVLAVLALTTACEAHYPDGPAGRVTDRQARYLKSSGWHYSLTVGGKTFRVTRDNYRDCFHGSSYPACTTRGGGQR